jgi:hypothetical protein
VAEHAFSSAAARRILGLGPDDGAEAVERAFRREIGPAARAAASDAAASERMRALIDARRALRGGPEKPDPVPPPDAAAPAAPKAEPPAECVAALRFELIGRGPHVAVDIAIDALEALAARGVLTATLRAPVLRRCPSCTGAGHGACAHCGGTGVVRTQRMRFAPLDIERLARDDMRIDADPWSDAAGRAARAGPALHARLV